MNILFIGTTGIHHVLLAAHQYLGIDGMDFSGFKYWGDHQREGSGRPLFLDRDNRGNKVFAVGVGPSIAMAEKSISQLLQILKVPEQEIIVKPIYSRYDPLWGWLYRLETWAATRRAANGIIEYLLRRDSDRIKSQVEEFQKEVR
jgi:hypothetical protein